MRTAVALAIVLLTGCGGPAAPPSSLASSSRTTSTSTSPSSALGSSRLLLVVEQQDPGSGQAGSIRLFSEDGMPYATFSLQASTNVLGVAGGRIFISPSDGSLRAIGRDGTVETLVTGGSASTRIGGFAASPDGTRWVWVVQSSDTTSESAYVGGEGLTAHVIATLPYPTVLAPYAWTSEGVVMDSEPMDYFGYRPFDTPFMALGGMQLLDPGKGTIRAFSSPSQCVFSDIAGDGTTACFPKLPSYLDPTLHTLRIVNGSGAATDIVLALPRFKYVGDAYFSTDGAMLTVAGATGAGCSPPTGGGPGCSSTSPPEEYGTDLVRVADASIARFGPAGVRPAMGRQSWLPDGRLVLWRPNSVGGPAGLYVLDPHSDGQSSEIPVAGIPVGYMTA